MWQFSSQNKVAASYREKAFETHPDKKTPECLAAAAVHYGPSADDV